MATQRQQKKASPRIDDVVLDFTTVYVKGKDTISGISAVTDLSRNTVRKLLQGKVKSIRLTTIAVLCQYFNCDPGDFIRIV